MVKADSLDPSILEFGVTNEYPVVFKWSSQNHPARNVYLTGSWDKWNRKVPLVKSTNDFSTIINLNPGKLKYFKYLKNYKVVMSTNFLLMENGLWMIICLKPTTPWVVKIM